MCGIAGIINKNQQNLTTEIVSMCEIIKHRGPDGFGYYNGENFALGHRRLSIIDLSENGKQPMKYKDNSIITFNGEIFNYIELREELLSVGYSFQSKTDTEVILVAYQHWGKECLNHFNGMFSFAIYDIKKNILFCARDRFGIKPFYYRQSKENFAFASEIKQFTVLENWKSIANKNKISEFLINEGIHDHTNETLFKDVYQLMGGESLEYSLSNHSHTIYKWYNLKPNINHKNLSFDQAKKKFKELFNSSINLRLRSDVKIGSCLSGGLDSSAIVCAINEKLKKSDNTDLQETVSACFNDAEIDEREFINEVVENTKVNSYKVFPSFEKGFSLLDKILWHQDEPFGTTSIYAQWSVYEEARSKDITVMLDGQGADEYLAGYGLFQQIRFLELFDKLQLFKLFKSLKNYREKYKDYYNNPYRNILSRKFRFYTPEWIKSILLKKNKVKWLKYYKTPSINTDKINTIQKLTKNQLFHTSLPKLLHHQDRNSMAHSIESRPPFLDYRLIELVYSLPSDYKVNKGVTKFILRESLKELIPKKILNRYDKLGFATPQERWFNENQILMRKEIEDASNVLKFYIDKKEILNLYDHSNHTRNKHLNLFWRIICLNHWVKVFKVSI
jgi:asparagine synthase (glutamine-hydrolysing)